MKRHAAKFSRFVAAALAAALAACGTAPTEHFYTLSADAPRSRATTNVAARFSIAVGPVTLAEMADRPQLLVQLADNRVAILEQQRWAEPLAGEIPRVVALNLARLLVAANVSTQAKIAGAEADVRIALDIQRFEAIVGKEVAIEVLWSISRRSGGEAVSGRAVVNEPVRASDYEAIVAAYSRALATLSQALADAIAKSAVPTK